MVFRSKISDPVNVGDVMRLTSNIADGEFIVNKSVTFGSYKYNYMFLDVYNKYCDDNGFLNPTMKDHQVHIKENVHIVEFLDNLIKQEKWS